MWSQLRPILHGFYDKKGLKAVFNAEEIYLSKAFKDIDNLWNTNLTKIHKVKYIMLSESPLWGQMIGKYIYNPFYQKDSSFFRCNDLSFALNKKSIATKDLVNELNRIGFVIIDVSPFALNKEDTSINYSILSKGITNNYFDLIEPTIDIFLKEKINKIKPLLDKRVKVFYRYRRIEKHLGTKISLLFENYNLRILSSPYNNIGYMGGGINKEILKKVLQKESSFNTFSSIIHSIKLLLFKSSSSMASQNKSSLL